MDKYDIILALIPTLFAKINILGYFIGFIGLPSIKRILMAGMGGLLILCYALFISPPRDVKLLHHQ